MRYVAILLLMSGLSTRALSQEVRATAHVDSNSIAVGDQLKVYLEVQHPPNVTTTIPLLADSLEGIEVVERSSPVSRQSGSDTLQSMTFTITSFDSGMHMFPPLTIQYVSATDTTKRTVVTSPIPVFVHGIAVDTSKEIKDIKAPLSLPITLADLLPYIISAAVLALLIWLFLYYRKKRKRGELFIPEAPPRPAHEIAMEALRSLESEKLWQRGKIKEYHSTLTDIVRLYIERRFNVMAMEMTSDEILDAKRIAAMPKDVHDQLKAMLVRADFVKFAKYQPVQSEHEQSLTDAVAFVEATWNEQREPAKQRESAEVQS